MAMNPDNNSLNEESFDNPIHQGDQGHWITTASTPSTIEYDMQIEQDICLLSVSETHSIFNDTDNNNNNSSQNEGQQQQQQQETQMTSTLSEYSSLPMAASTPLLTAAAATTDADDGGASAITVTTDAGAVVATATHRTRRSRREYENELFQNTQNLVREFITQTNCEYPCYRVMRWTIGEQPKLEYVLTVVINRPTIVLE